jgi:tRNA(Ile)-lysidine synthase
VNDVLQRVKANIHRRKLLKRSQKILVAVSGGLDSMTLLHILNTLAKENHWKLFVAHFNHQLRGHASNADEKLVRKAASKLKLPIVVENADVKAFAKKARLSIEMAARKLRQEFFARAARARKIKTITLAHHADDQVELFFLRLLRGAGGEGLAGMKWQSPSPADKNLTLVRPLLDLTKTELQEFACKNKIQFRDDATNSSLDFLRNRIRNELLPLLKTNYQPALNQTVLRLMEIVGAESDFVGKAAQPANKNNFEKQPLAIQRRILQGQLIRLNLPVDFELIETLRQLPGQFISVGSKMSVARNQFGKVRLRTESQPEFKADKLILNLTGRAGEAIFSVMKFKWKLVNGLRKRPRRQRQIEFFDADKIGNRIILRHWRPGDKFWPIGLESPAKLQDLFTNAKIPREQRRNLILATAAGGEIFWVEGLRISENFKLTPETKRCLVWHGKNVG